ncbi:DUF1364 family protein [Klebsiella michiganensis]|jgi:hypothetical protein|nr:DUF1364 family protein [Klebsiella michiganensis]
MTLPVDGIKLHRGNFAAVGQQIQPLLDAAIACSSCHDEIDRRTRLVDAEYAKECALEGMARTQVIWMKEGLIKA